MTHLFSLFIKLSLSKAFRLHPEIFAVTQEAPHAGLRIGTTWIFNVSAQIKRRTSTSSTALLYGYILSLIRFWFVAETTINLIDNQCCVQTDSPVKIGPHSICLWRASWWGLTLYRINFMLESLPR